MKENMTNKIEAKESQSCLSNEKLWSPENMRAPHIMATAVMDILTSVYGRHNLTDSVENLSGQIESGLLKPWIKVENKSNRPLSCAALIDHGDKVEIGRAANHPFNGGKGGGNLMKKACKWHLKHDDRPLVAEIRMAKEFKGIEGGQASQHILLSKLGFIPHAFVPAFHHPGPNNIDRQEIFCFATLPAKNLSWKKEDFHPLVRVTLPDRTFRKVGKEAHFILWGQTGGWQSIIPIKGVIHDLMRPDFKAISKKKLTKVRIEFNGIFHQIKLDQENGILIKDAWKNLLSDPEFRFALAEIEQLTQEDMWAQNELQHAGATFLGFTFSPENIKTLWGILSEKVTLAPSECAHSLPEQITSFMHNTENNLNKKRLTINRFH